MPEDPRVPEPDDTLDLRHSRRPGGSQEPDHLGEFEILRELGRGGMGVVYEARQPSLDRRVALKVLPQTFALSRQATQRFEREARAAARLQHRNIVAVHAIGEDRGQHFYAMELVDGVSLDKVLKELSGGGWHRLLDGVVTSKHPTAKPGVAESQFRTGSRAWFDSISTLIAEVADGLEYAHSQGVIHRDIKPANLMLSIQGHVCITDFGLAQLAQEPGMTMSGALIGTPAYMSPEQVAAGRMPLDHRTDIYSLGAVLYEILTLQRPFAGASRDEVIGGVLTKDPATPSRVKATIPLDLETIYLKALEKDPDRRYQTAAEMARDLREYVRGGMITARPIGPLRRVIRWARRHPTAMTMILSIAVMGTLVALFRDRLLNPGPSPGREEIHRLAVLPFRNPAGDADGELEADGMTELLITELGQINDLELIARRSAMQYKNSPKSIQEIAHELNVDAIVEGTVTRFGDRVRVTANLVDAATESQLWGDRYERSQHDILMLQGEVAQGIANQIRAELSPEDQALLTTNRVVSPEAHKAYLIGKSYVDRWSKDAVEKGIRYLEEALEYDPDFARAHAGLATAYLYSASVGGGWNPPGEAVDKARRAATTALQLDGSLAEAHTAMGALHMVFDWNLELAEREFERAIELNPSFADARVFYAILLRRIGGARLVEGMDQLELAIQTDPLNPFYRVHKIWALMEAGDPAQATKEYEHLVDLGPEPVLLAQGVLAKAFIALNEGRADDGVALMERCVELTERQHPDMLTYLGSTYEFTGRHADAIDILNELTALARKRYVSPVLFAELHSTMGDVDEAFDYLEQAYTLRCGYLFMLSRTFLPGLASDPRWDDLVKRIGLPEQLPAS